MSGETPTTTTGRFTSQNNHYANSNNSTSNKKYPGSPKSPLLNTSLNNNAGGSRNLHARQRLLTSKVSAPRPINLPSLRREHASGTTETTSASPGSQHGWGSTNSSPSPAQNEKEQVHEAHNTSPTLISSQNTTRAWVTPSTNKVQAPTNDFPTAAEASKKTDDKEFLKFVASDPNHTSWDEMVNEDLDDFSVDVMEFKDGTRVQVETDTDPNSPVLDTVSPSERFNDDYDRSYTNQHPRSNYHHYEHNDHHMNNGYRPYRRSVDQGYHPRYNTHYENRRFNSGDNERRSSSTERWSRRESSEHYNNTRRESSEHYNTRKDSTEHFNNPRRESSEHFNTRRDSTEHYHPRRDSSEHYNRRPSHDKSYHPASLHPTHQRTRRPSEQSSKSDHSREDTHEHNPLQIIPEPGVTEEITVAQKNVMLTAAERAKRRFDEQEAEYKAAAERAKQKAAALAEKEKQRNKSVDENTNTSKPWNLVAAKHENNVHTKPTPTKILTHANEFEDQVKKSEPEKKPDQSLVQKKPEQPPTEKKPEPVEKKPAEKEKTQDEKNWEDFVEKTRHNQDTTEHAATVSDWHSYATRLQEKDGHKYNYTYNTPEVVEVHDYSQNEDWGTLPNHLVNGKGRTGWVRNDRRGKGNNQWRDKKMEEPGMIEILKHEPKVEKTPVSTAHLSNKERVQLLLKESVSPLFPNFLAKLVIKKPSHISFMVDTEESDKEITMMDQQDEQVEKTPEMETHMDKSMSTISSAESHVGSPSPKKTNPHYPVLMYQYPSDVEEEPKDSQQQQRHLGVFFMPPQSYLSSNQFMVPYPQAGTGNTQPIYFPPLPWQQQEQQYESRPYQERRRSSFGSYKQKPQDWNRNNDFPRSRGGYRKRASWSNQQAPPHPPRGRGGGKRYPEEEY